MRQQIENIYHAVSAFTAALYYGFPGKKLTVVGVTGTDGKTTTTHLIDQILKSAGKKTSVISSVYAEIAGKRYETGFHVTTPNEWQMQRLLSIAFKRGVEYMVVEVTSHGLDQHRVDWIDFKIGVLTNVTHEHLDYHKTFTSYLKAKERLLQRADKAIVNQDDESFVYLKLPKDKLVTYGIYKKADFMPKTLVFTSPLPGEYNIYNCLAAVSVCTNLGISKKIIQKALKTFAGVKGRFEFVPHKLGFDVIIDFAHTPNAFEKVLSTLKSRIRYKMIHVFGSASERDVSKRPIMGQISAKYADFIVLTEEDYRREDVNKIIGEIARGCLMAGTKEYLPKDVSLAQNATTPVFFRIPNRKEAIDFAIQELAKPGDSVILTGKAHEKSLCRGTREYPWDERKAVLDALKGKKDAANP